jgi:phosphomannomutase
MSAHHYFRDFAYCDSGMIPWLLVAQLVSIKGQSIGQLVKERIAAYPSSGEINIMLEQPAATIAKVEEHYRAQAKNIDYIDGVSMEFDQWRFNLRSSNTEPVVRLNVESRGDIALMQAKSNEIMAMLRQ